MNSLWWLALPVLLLPVWWHRQKREQTKAEPLATARFVPRVEPDQVRVWRWRDILLLLVRCLLLATVIAWLADPVFPWRGDTVVVATGTDAAWAQVEIAKAGFNGAQRLEQPGPQALDWLRSHEREWRDDARLLVVGDIPMPAAMPGFSHRVELRTRAVPVAGREHHVAIVSERAAQWRRLFAAAAGTYRFIIDEQPGAASDLIVWDRPEPPPDGMRAPLWLVGNPAAFPELAKAAEVAGLRYADSSRGRLWASDAWPPGNEESARRLLRDWQSLHHAPLPYTAPSQALPVTQAAGGGLAEGALRAMLAAAIVALFALERILAHARRR